MYGVGLLCKSDPRCLESFLSGVQTVSDLFWMMLLVQADATLFASIISNLTSCSPASVGVPPGHPYNLCSHPPYKRQ